MAEAVSAIFRIVEPMIFRGSGEFDPSVRGTYSRAISLAVPSPSTVAGTIATYCISELGIPAPSSGGWLDRYISVLGGDVGVRGPLIRLKNELMVEDRLSRGLLTMEKVMQKCVKEWKRLRQKPNSLNELDEYLKREQPEKNRKKDLSIKEEKDVRVGVRLEAREGTARKSAKEGFLYSAEYIDYTGAKSKEERETSIEIIAEIRGKLVKSLSSARGLPVKFGGEGRVAHLSFVSGEKILDEIRGWFWGDRERHDGLLALYLATPALFKGGERVEECIKRWAGGMNYEFVGLSGESTVLGTGFIISEEKRKPIYTSLSPGSIIFLKGGFDLLKIYRDEGLGEASMLGYGTHIPIPIVDNA